MQCARLEDTTRPWPCLDLSSTSPPPSTEITGTGGGGRALGTIFFFFFFDWGCWAELTSKKEKKGPRLQPGVLVGVLSWADKPKKKWCPSVTDLINMDISLLFRSYDKNIMESKDSCSIIIFRMYEWFFIWTFLAAFCLTLKMCVRMSFRYRGIVLGLSYLTCGASLTLTTGALFTLGFGVLRIKASFNLALDWLGTKALYNLGVDGLRIKASSPVELNGLRLNRSWLNRSSIHLGVDGLRIKASSILWSLMG